MRLPNDSAAEPPELEPIAARPSGSLVSFIKEEPLVACILQKIQDVYLSPENLDRLKIAIRREQQRSQVEKPIDLVRLRKKIKDLDRKIDRGADRILAVPDEIVDDLCRRLEKLKNQRQEFAGQLQHSCETETRGSGDQEVDQAISVLWRLKDTIRDASPSDLQELFSQILSRVELRFKYRKLRKYVHSELTSGTVALSAGAPFPEMADRSSAFAIRNYR